jgi:hypothetical protein
MQSRTTYKQKFALIPVTVESNNRIWLKNYYTVYKHYGHGSISNGHSHRDRIENISEQEYVVRKLTDGF